MTPEPPHQNGSGSYEIPTGQLDKILYLVRAVGVPVAVCGVVIWHGWKVADGMRLERREHDIFARETLMVVNGQSIEALAITTEAVKANQIQSQRVEAAIDAQIEVGEAVIEAVESLNDCVDELKEHNQAVP